MSPAAVVIGALILMQLQLEIYGILNRYMAKGSSTSSVKYHCETHIITNTVMKQMKGRKGEMKPEGP